VLSTQFSNALFRICFFVAWEGKTFSLLSDQFKTVSKQDQIRRRQERLANPTKPKSKIRKRARGQDIWEVLGQIKKTQADHLKILNRLENEEKSRKKKEPNAAKMMVVQTSKVVKTTTSPVVATQGKSDVNDSSITLKDAVLLLVQAYRRESPEERPTKIRKLIHDTDSEVFNEMVGAFNASDSHLSGFDVCGSFRNEEWIQTENLGAFCSQTQLEPTSLG